MSIHTQARLEQIQREVQPITLQHYHPHNHQDVMGTNPSTAVLTGLSCRLYCPYPHHPNSHHPLAAEVEYWPLLLCLFHLSARLGGKANRARLGVSLTRLSVMLPSQTVGAVIDQIAWSARYVQQKQEVDWDEARYL